MLDAKTNHVPANLSKLASNKHASIQPDIIDAPEMSVEPSSLDMKKEADRLKSFETWPVRFIDKFKLAKNGFYYMRVDDRVKCEFCKVEIGRWEEGDDPNIDHQRWAPNCPFLRNRPVGNEPLDPSQAPVPRPGPSYDTCGSSMTIRPNSTPESHLSMGIPITKGPEHPMYATDVSRVRSYAQWPSSLQQKPAELSEAGFFYTGQGDRTVCYHCGGGLKDWEPADIPWEQHTRWFPKCTYVQLMKGKEYVKAVTSTMPSTLTPNEAQALESAPSINATIPSDPAKITPLSEVQQPPKSSSPVADDKLCKICYIEEKNAVFVPCGHVVSCIKCSLSVKECPVCRQAYSGVMRVFFS